MLDIYADLGKKPGILRCFATFASKASSDVKLSVKNVLVVAGALIVLQLAGKLTAR